MKKVTLVTGLWDLNRVELEDFGRHFDHYLSNFAQLLSLDVHLVCYVPPDLVPFVTERRDMTKTRIVVKTIDQLVQWFPFYDALQTVRTNPYWFNQADWLKESPQALLVNYNTVVMSKFFMLNDAATEDTFDSEYYFWIDAALTNTVSLDLISHVNKIPTYMEKEKKSRFLMLAFPYRNEYEVHGFETSMFDEFCAEMSTYVCRGGFFGGTKSAIHELNGDYYSYLQQTLDIGYMGTEENILTILSHESPDTISLFHLEDNGLIYPFFEELKNVQVNSMAFEDLIPYDKHKSPLDIKTSLYVLSFNSPQQFEDLMKSMRAYDDTFYSHSRKILIDNSTDYSTYAEYQRLCQVYYFEHIKKQDNIGICGGRQFVAEHFHESDSEYYIFFEDDMQFEKDRFKTLDVNDFSIHIDDLYMKSLKIIHKDRLDYLKLNYTEFFGDNDVQWAWYNVPQHVRDTYFPDNRFLPEEGFAEDPPMIIPEDRKRYKDLWYLTGDYYYCNWPMWMSKAGNKKIFIDTKWAHPHEQTWMSHVFQLQKRGRIKSAVLELSPTNHNRYDFYDASERKES